MKHSLPDAEAIAEVRGRTSDTGQFTLSGEREMKTVHRWAKQTDLG